MKKISIFLLINVFILFLVNQNLYNEETIKGGIKKCTATRYEYKLGKIDSKSKSILWTKKYDNKKNIIELLEYAENRLVKHEFAKYDLKGNKIANVINVIGQVVFKNTFTYDNNGYLKESINIIEDSYGTGMKYISNFNYEFNDKGNMTKKKTLVDGHIAKIDTYKYNNKDLKIEWTSYDANESVISKTNYKYDDQGNLIAISINGPDGKYIDNDIYNYNDKGLKIEVIHYSYDGMIYCTENYKYDKKGNIIEEIKFDNYLLKPISVIKYTYSK